MSERESKAIKGEVDDSLIEKVNSPEIQTKNIKKNIIIFFCISIIILILIVGIFFGVLFRGENEEKGDIGKHSILRLTKWEAVSSKVIDLNEEEISTGVKSEKFFKAPENWTVTTAMGAIVGDSNDIFYRTNLKEIDKLQFDDPWWFRAPFKKQIKDNDLIILHINGINYKTDLWIDGQKVNLKEEIIGAFVRFDIDISKYLKKNSENHTIAFYMKRPHNQWGMQYLNETDLAITFVDWNPEPPDSNLGVWQPVDVEIMPEQNILITDPFVITKLNDEATEANVTIVSHFRNFKNKKITSSITFKLFNEINEISYTIKNFELNELENKTVVITSEQCKDLLIKSPKLWNPIGMGEQNFYVLSITINENNKITKRVGLRQVESIMSEDKKVRTYLVNKKKYFMRGAGFTPDLFLRASPEFYKKHIDYVKHMNLNTIRLEGKFEHEEFYDLCDEYGIMIMDGFSCSDAWQKWEQWDEKNKFIGRNSVRSQILRLASHPSVFVFLVGSDLPPTPEIETDWLDNVINLELWPNEVLSSANESPDSQVTGPTGVKMTGPYFWVPPHYFLGDTKEERGGAYSFLTEGGPGENSLRKGSFEKVFGKEEMKWPLDEKLWMYHCGNKEKFNDHDVLFTHVEKRFGNPIDFDDYLRKEAASVIDSHKAMYEAYSLKRYRSTGLINWMLNNAWPSNIWHLYDYFYMPTPSYFAIKSAGEDLHVLYAYDDSHVYISNNVWQTYLKSLNVHSYIIDGLKGTIINTYNDTILNPIEGDSVIDAYKIKLPTNTSNYFIHLECLSENKLISANTYWLSQKMDRFNISGSTYFNVEILEYADLTDFQNLPKIRLNINKTFKQLETKGHIDLIIENKSNIFAFMIELRLIDSETQENITPVFWSDNYFSLLAGSSRTIQVEFENPSNKDISNIEISGWNIENDLI